MHSRKRCCHGKAVSRLTTNFECESVALFLQHAKRMRRFIVISGLYLPYFSTLTNKQHDFQKELLNIKCVF